IMHEEFNIVANDRQGGASAANAQVSLPISYNPSFEVRACSHPGVGCPSAWVSRQFLALGSFRICIRYESGAGSSLFFPPNVATGVAFQANYAIGGAGVVTNGWFETMVNAANPSATVTITPTAPSEINGGLGAGTRTKLNIFPNEWCETMSDGTNYNSICGFTPNLQTDGVVGGNVTMSAAPNTAGVTSIGATT